MVVRRNRPIYDEDSEFKVFKEDPHAGHVKTYDGIEDLDHLKIFQASTKIERPHRNLPYQAERGRVAESFHGKIQGGKYACQRSTRMHENIVIHARGEVAAANQSNKKAPPAWKHHEIGHRPNFDNRLDFKSQHKSIRRQDRFTPPTKTPKEILAMDTVKVKAPPPMTRPAENQNKNKFCEFHGDKSHSTNECIYLRRQIEEVVKSGQLSHLVKEIKQRGKRGEQAKAAKKGEAPNKEKATAIFMGDEEHSTSALMNFMVVRSPSPYNGIIGRMGLRKIQAVLSIAHGMLKFPVERGIAMIHSSTITSAEYKMIATLIPSVAVGSLGGEASYASVTILHSADVMGWTMKIAVAFSLLGASPFFAAFACSPLFPLCFISLTRGARVAIEDKFGAAEEREVSCEAQQGRSGVKMKLFTGGQSERTFWTLENMFRACVRNLVVVRILTFSKAEIGESKMIGLELEQETTKVFVIKERLKEDKDS
uniref:Reverse transcriptase domain-containing protein n=1 Tax=Tanacetum cinerariifolium TaxID=118510 RepID=A0A699H3Y5_TANCI|nr:reverse transcriptase domain-containing protein [Tanacetum cinerariifolium]